MLHEPAPQSPVEDLSSAKKAHLGVLLFWIYSLIYAGFVMVNALAPATMGTEVILGLNLAVVYGFGLIILAIVLGLVYNLLCTRMEDRMNQTPSGREG